MKPHIEQYNRKNQQRVKEFILERYREFGFGYIEKYDYDLENFEEYYLQSGGMFFVLKDNDAVLGTIGIINRGKGFGSKLIDTALTFCNDHHFQKIEFETNKIFKIVHALYQKKGVKIVKEDEHSFYMEKIL